MVVRPNLGTTVTGGIRGGCTDIYWHIHRIIGATVRLSFQIISSRGEDYTLLLRGFSRTLTGHEKVDFQEKCL